MRLILVRIADRDGIALTEAEVRVRLHRPAHGGHDREVALAAVADGSYAADIGLALAGLWELHVIAEHGGDVWRSRTRMVVP